VAVCRVIANAGERSTAQRFAAGARCSATGSGVVNKLVTRVCLVLRLFRKVILVSRRAAAELATACVLWQSRAVIRDVALSSGAAKFILRLINFLIYFSFTSVMRPEAPVSDLCQAKASNAADVAGRLSAPPSQVEASSPLRRSDLLRASKS
jgi:hypothetical protein